MGFFETKVLVVGLMEPDQQTQFVLHWPWKFWLDSFILWNVIQFITTDTHFASTDGIIFFIEIHTFLVRTKHEKYESDIIL